MFTCEYVELSMQMADYVWVQVPPKQEMKLSGIEVMKR